MLQDLSASQIAATDALTKKYQALASDTSGCKAANSRNTKLSRKASFLGGHDLQRVDPDDEVIDRCAHKTGKTQAAVFGTLRSAPRWKKVAMVHLGEKQQGKKTRKSSEEVTTFTQCALRKIMGNTNDRPHNKGDVVTHMERKQERCQWSLLS